MSYPERIDPDATEPGILALHLKRYDFALPFCDDADVLDAACGAGYGSAHLARAARRVVGVDASAEAIGFARSRYSGPSVEFRVGDVQALPDRDAEYDVVCSFETIEHVDDPEQALASFARVLRQNGVLIVSTPNAKRTTYSPENRFHQVEWAAADFETLVHRYFDNVEMYGQRRLQSGAHRLVQRLDILRLRSRSPFLRRGARLLGTTPLAELSLDEIVIDRDRLERASEIVAVCRSPRL